jgi:hypothetical protein
VTAAWFGSLLDSVTPEVALSCCEPPDASALDVLDVLQIAPRCRVFVDVDGRPA